MGCIRIRGWISPLVTGKEASDYYLGCLGEVLLLELYFSGILRHVVSKQLAQKCAALNGKIDTHTIQQKFGEAFSQVYLKNNQR